MPRLAGDIPYRLLGGGQPTQACNRTNSFLANPQSKDHHNAALFFDGVNDAAIIFGNVDLDIANEWSHMIWVAPGQMFPLTKQTLYSVGVLGGVNNNAIEISIEAGGVLSCEVFNSSGLLIKKRSITSLDSSAPGVDGFFFGAGLWHQIVITWDGSTLKVYRNGVFMNTFMTNVTDVAGSQTNTNRSITVGNVYSPIVGNKMNGVVHSTAHWNTELTAAEIAAIFSSGRAGEFDLNQQQLAYTSASSLRSWYRLGATPSNTVYQNSAPVGFPIVTTQAAEKVVRSAPEGAVLTADGATQFSTGFFNTGLGTSMTLAAWAKCDSLPAEGQTQDVIRFRVPAGGVSLVALSITTTGGVSYWVFEVSDSTNTITNTILGDTPVQEGIWYHILGCKNENFSIRFFVNGVDDVAPVVAGVATTTNVNRVASFPYDGRLGFSPAGGHNNFVGDVHSVACWSVPVSENGVRALFNGGWADLDLTTTHPCYSEAPSLTHWWLTGTPDSASASAIPDQVAGGPDLFDGLSSHEQSQRFSVESSLIGTSCDFDTSSGLGTATALPIGIGDSFTISMWLYPRDLTVNRQFPLYIGPTHPSSSNEIQWGIFGDIADDPFKINVQASTGTTIERVAFFDMLLLEEWQNITMVWSDTTMTVYHNGVLVPGTVEVSIGGSIVDGSRFIDIGGSENALIPPFGEEYDGLISHVGIWNSELTSNEIRTIVSQRHSLDLRYNKDDYQSAENLQHYYKLGEDTFLKGRDFADTLRSTNVSQLTVETGTVTSVVESPGAPVSVAGSLRSVALDGATEYYLHDTDTDLNFADMWTISLWAQQALPFPVAGAPRLVEIRSSANDGNWIQIYMLSSGALGVWVYALDFLPLWTANYEHVFTDNDWNNVVVRWDGTNIDVYINGYLQHPETIITDSPGTMGNAFGRKVSYGSKLDGTLPWNGNVGHLGIWDSPLNQANITEIYNGNHNLDLSANFGNYIQSADLVHYWRPGFDDEGFDDEVGSPAADFVDSVGINIGNIVIDAPPSQEQGSERSVLLAPTTDYYRRAGDVAWQMANAWSVGFWAKHDGAFPSSSRTLFNLQPSGSFNSGIFCAMDGLGQISFSTGKAAGAGILWAGVWNNVFDDQAWHHILFTWDGVAIDMHIDGVFTAPSSTSFDGLPGVMADDARELGYGSGSGGGFTKWGNHLGHLGLWDAALTPAEAAEITAGGHLIDLRQNQGSYASSANLVHYWRLGFIGEDPSPGFSDESTLAFNASNSRDFDFGNGVDETNIDSDAP